MTHPLIERLTTEFDYPHLDTQAALDAHLETQGTHCLFVPGNPKRNLESADVAVILPELKMAFQGQFTCAVVGDGIETELRQTSGVLKTPSLIFFRNGEQIGSIPKVRDWDEYILRIQQILSVPVAA